MREIHPFWPAPNYHPLMLRFSTAGESHGPALMATVEGLPRGLAFPEQAINAELARRQGGYGRGGRMRIEKDQVEVLCGVNHGKLTGAPVAMVIRNRDARLDKAAPLTRARPGHVDLAAALKHGETDARDFLERASARETAARVAVGALCSSYLAAFGIRSFGYVRAIGEIESSGLEVQEDGAILPDVEALIARRDASPFYTAEPGRDEAMRLAVDQAKAEGDTLGGIVEVVVFGMPPGLGRHTQWDLKLDGKLAQACMSIQAVKGVDIGMGFAAAQKRGSAVHDPILPRSHASAGDTAASLLHANASARFCRASNHAGGIEGGLSNGEPIILRLAFKPISTLMQPLASVDLRSGEAATAATERSDTCAVPAGSVVAQNVVCVPILEALLDKFGGDTLAETQHHFAAFRAALGHPLP